MDETNLTASVIDDLPFPYLRDYDLNLWIDDDNYLRASAYQLCLTEVSDKDENEDSVTTWQMDNNGCADPITLVCVHYDDYNEPDREAIFGDLSDEWDTIVGFLLQPKEWLEKYPNFYALVCEGIQIELMDDFGNIEDYEACQHAIK